MKSNQENATDPNATGKPPKRKKAPPTLKVIKRTLAQTASAFMAGRIGEYTQQDVYAFILEKTGELNLDELKRELAWQITKDTIRSRSTPRLASNDDWIGYGEMAICLSEGKIVNLYSANNEALDIREHHVVENHGKITRAKDEEIARLNQIRETMKTLGCTTAGPAIDVLAAAEGDDERNPIPEEEAA